MTCTDVTMFGRGPQRRVTNAVLRAQDKRARTLPQARAHVNAQTALPCLFASAMMRSMSSRVVNIAGAVVNLDDLSATIRTQLASATVWCNREDCDNFDGLQRALMCSGEYGRDFSIAVLDLLLSDDVSERTAACKLLPHLQLYEAATRINEILQSRPFLFVGVSPRGYSLDDPDLEMAILSAMANVVRQDELQAIQTLQRAVPRVAKPGSLTPALAWIVPDWVCQNAHFVPHSSALPTLRKLPTHAYRDAFVQALAPWLIKDRDYLLKLLKTYSMVFDGVQNELSDLLQNASVRSF